MSIVIVLVITALLAAAILGAGVLTARDGYRRVPERPIAHRVRDVA